MIRRILTVTILLLLAQYLHAQKAEDVIVLKIKSNYKIFHEGEQKFEQNCAGCHGINEPLISVGLADIHTKRSREWLLKFLQMPQTLEYSDDPETMAYKKEYGTVNHDIIRELDEEDYNDILDFVESELNGPMYDADRIKEEYFVLQKNSTVKVGDYRYYFPNGNLSHFYKFNNGLPWEVIEVFDVFGERKNGGTLKNGTGTLVTYDNYGNKESTTTYIGGFRSGEYKKYFDGGQVELKGFYTDGRANGQWTYYYPSGDVKNYINYSNGRIISNREGDRPDFHPGIAPKRNYTSEVKKNKPTTSSHTKTTVVENVEHVIYPYNAKINWDIKQLSNREYTSLGNDLMSMIILKREEEIYSKSSINFRRFHPPVVMKTYLEDMGSYGEMEFYRMDGIGFTTVRGQSLVLMEYFLSFQAQKIKMYLSYIKEGGTYKLDGWSYETTNAQ